jgi:hypothetical protein
MMGMHSSMPVPGAHVEWVTPTLAGDRACTEGQCPPNPIIGSRVVVA